jgi:uncharacterized protein with PIN domain
MVIDTSALLAILQDEPERRTFNEAIEAAETRSRLLHFGREEMQETQRRPWFEIPPILILCHLRIFTAT